MYSSAEVPAIFIPFVSLMFMCMTLLTAVSVISELSLWVAYAISFVVSAVASFLYVEATS